MEIEFSSRRNIPRISVRSPRILPSVSVISNHSIYHNWSKISFVLIERSSNSNRSRQKSDFPEEFPRHKFDRVFLVPFLMMCLNLSRRLQVRSSSVNFD